MTININIPSAWNECNAWQIYRIARLMHSGVTGLRFDYVILVILMQVKWYHFRRMWKLKWLQMSATFPDIKQFYSWLYEQTDLTVFHPKTIKSNGIVFHAPADRLSNINADEFAHADDLFVEWYNTKKLVYLQYLAAVLYAEVDEKGKRIPFDKELLEAKAKRFKKINREKLLAISLVYVGCRSHLAPQFPHVFPKKKGEQTKQTKLQSSGFGKVSLHLAGGKFGNYSETKATNIYAFLAEYNELLKQEKQKKRNA